MIRDSFLIGSWGGGTESCLCGGMGGGENNDQGRGVDCNACQSEGVGGGLVGGGGISLCA